MAAAAARSGIREEAELLLSEGQEEQQGLLDPKIARNSLNGYSVHNCGDGPKSDVIVHGPKDGQGQHNHSLVHVGCTQSLLNHERVLFHDAHDVIADATTARSAFGGLSGQASKQLNEDYRNETTFNPSEFSNVQLWKNLILVSCAFMLNFSAWVSYQTVASTLHLQNGTLLLSCFYSFSVLSCLLAPIALRLMNAKQVMLLCTSLYLPFVAAQFWPRMYVLVPTAVLLGLGTGALWTSQAVYTVTLALQHGRLAKLCSHRAIQRFIAFFYCFYNASQVLGNLLTLTVLHSTSHAATQSVTSLTSSSAATGEPPPADSVRDITVLVGPDHMPSWHTYLLTQLDTYNAQKSVVDSNRTTLLREGRCLVEEVSVATGALERLLLPLVQALCVVLSLILLAALPSVGLSLSRGGRDSSRSLRHLATGLWHLVTDPRLLLLAPLVIFTGLESGFLMADFTQSFITCVVGFRHIGSVLVCYGSVTAVASFLADHVAHHVTRRRVLDMGALLHTGALLTLLLWKPEVDDSATLYTLAATLGLCHAIWDTQTNALFATVFHQSPEAAFAVYRMLTSAALAAAFGYSSALSNTVKISIMTGFLFTGHLLYSFLESNISRKARQERVNIV